MSTRITAALSALAALALLGAAPYPAPRNPPLTIPAPPPSMPSKTGPPRGDYDFGFVAGPPWSSEFAIAAALSTAAAQGQEGGPHGEPGPRLAPLPVTSSDTSLDDLLASPATDLAIVSVPALERAAQKWRAIKSRIAYVAPLFPQEIHVLVKGDVSRIEDLRNRRVALQSPNGEAARLFDAIGIPIEKVALPTMAQLTLDKIDADAVVLVSSQPVTALQEASGWKLLAVPFRPELQGEFLPGSFSHDVYPNLVPADRIDTVSVRTALVAYNWPKKWERSQILGTVVVGMLDHAADAIGQGATRRLAEVNWAARLPGWQRYEPAERWIIAHQPQDATASVPKRKDTR